MIVIIEAVEEGDDVRRGGAGTVLLIIGPQMLHGANLPQSIICCRGTFSLNGIGNNLDHHVVAAGSKGLLSTFTSNSFLITGNAMEAGSNEDFEPFNGRLEEDGLQDITRPSAICCLEETLAPYGPIAVPEAVVDRPCGNQWV